MDRNIENKVFFGIVVSLSILILAVALRINDSIKIAIVENDYYQYIELGKNIFRNFDFTVRHQTGELVRPSPLFPALVHLTSLLNKNPILAIKWLNALSLSLSLIPLFLFAKSAFNEYIGLLASAFFIFFIGISKSLYILSSHVFLALPVVTVCWLTWKITTYKTPPNILIALDGFLISLATLIQGYAVVYLGIAVLFFLYFDIASGAFRYTFKKISYLLLGFLPLLIFYTAATSNTAKGNIIYDNNIKAFLSGNYYAGNMPRDQRFYQLNEDGAEFNILKEARNTSILSYCATYPRFITQKYKILFQVMLPLLLENNFARSLGHSYHFFYVALSILLITFAVPGILTPRFNRGIFYVFIWLSPLFFMPLILVKWVYLIPFFPFYAILLVTGGYNLYSLLLRKGYVKIFLLSVYIICILGFITSDIKFYKNMPSVDEYERAGLWIKNDARGRDRRITIMSRKTIFSYIADAEFIAIPYENDWDRVEKFARLKNVDYIVLDNRYYWGLLKQEPNSTDIKIVYQDISPTGNKITVYKIL